MGPAVRLLFPVRLHRQGGLPLGAGGDAEPGGKAEPCGAGEGGREDAEPEEDLHVGPGWGPGENPAGGAMSRGLGESR